MDDKTRQRLTEEIIGEEWHGLTGKLSPDGKWGMCACGRYCVVPKNHQTRTFTTEADMMTLYRAIQKMGKWGSFYLYSLQRFTEREDAKIDPCGMMSWLFCLNGEGYEERCQMVADWWEGEKR